MTRTLRFEVLGRPQPAGSKKAFQHAQTGKTIVMDDAKHSRSWKNTVAQAALEHRNGTGPFTGPVRLDLVFIMARPKCHYGTGRNHRTVKPSAPRYPATRPDTTKLVRAVEDALTTARVWTDDALVVKQTASKVYAGWEESEGCAITITEQL